MAKYYKVPFRQKVWYKYRVMLGRNNKDKTYVECFDKEGHYIYPIRGLDVIVKRVLQSAIETTDEVEV